MPNRRLVNRRHRVSLWAVCLCLSAPAAHALSFQFDFTAGTPVQAQNGFIAAGNLWSTVLADPVTVRLTVGMSALGGSTLGQAASTQLQYDYGSVVAALQANASSVADQMASASLRPGSIAMWINRTSDSPEADNTKPYLDVNGSANNTTVKVNSANALALGLPVSYGTNFSCLDTCDGFIQFNSAFSWDYDRANGVTSGTFDFVGIAAHEIGHVLGFVSGVDVLDSGPGGAEDVYTEVTPLDLFRYSAGSAADAAIDFAASSTAKYFSLDGGVTGATTTFSNGIQFGGDSRQASHWKDGLGLGLMDPTASTGELLVLTANDRTAMDVIGWQLSAVPEPGRATMLALGFAVVAIGWRRGRRGTA